MKHELLDTSYDGQFDAIGSLRWRPWVGRGYRTAPRRLLIVGDSCYAQDEDRNPSPETEADFLQDRDTTRGVLYCSLNREKKQEDTKDWPVYTRLYNTLVGGNGIEDRKRLWERVAYYYFVQNRVMNTTDDKPNEQDCRHAWSCFLEVVEVLRPTDCLVLGVRNTEAFGDSMEQAGLKWTIEEYPEPVGGSVQPRHATITWPKDGHTLDLWFMQHPSRCSPAAWREFLCEKMPEAMKLF